MNVEALMKENESLILGSIGVITVLFIIGGVYLLWARPKFLYMPIYESYEKDSDIGVDDEDDIGTEMKEGQWDDEQEVQVQRVRANKEIRDSGPNH